MSRWLLTGAFNSGVISFALTSPIGLGIFDTIIAAGVFLTASTAASNALPGKFLTPSQILPAASLMCFLGS